MDRLKWAQWFAWIATSLVALVVGVSFFFWEDAVRLVKENEQIFKLVGLGIGPFLAILGFIWGVVDKIELKHLAAQLGAERANTAAATKRANEAHKEVASKVARIEALEADLTTIADAGRLWKLRKNAPFADYRGWKHDPKGAKIVTVGLFKGGVGKTHLAANFAAYVSETQKKPVLLIDLDFQGSLSTSVLRSAGVEEETGSLVDALFEQNANLITLSAKRIHLAPRGASTSLNGGKGLARAWIVPADYTLAETESRLLVERVIRDSSGLDERYRLAHVLLHPDVRREFDLIILDTPPRMTLGTVNALVASHSYIVPVIPDRVSSEAVRPFLTQVERLKADLELDLDLAGVVATMTRQYDRLTDREARHWENIRSTVIEVAGSDRCVQQNIPDKVGIRDSAELGYFLKDDGPLTTASTMPSSMSCGRASCSHENRPRLAFGECSASPSTGMETQKCLSC